MQSYVITITETDDVELALEQLETQLSEIELLENTIGIVSVHPEFVESGIYNAVAKYAPFQLAGITSFAQNANGEIGLYLFSILVLTSDSCEFACESSDVISEKASAKRLTQKCFSNARSKLNGKVKLALLYAPIMEFKCSNEYIRAITAIDESVPVFGSLANADMPNLFAERKVLYNENSFGNRLVLVLVSGDIQPEFYIGSITKDAVIMPDIGTVTEAKENHVFKIDDMDADKFLDKIGFYVGKARNQGLLTSIFMVDKKDKDGNTVSSFSRGILQYNGKAIVFGGIVPKGSVLSIGTTTKKMVVNTARNVIEQIKEKSDGGAVLMYSCIGRRFSLRDEPMLELEAFSEFMPSSDFNYIASCSCGEICPTSVSKGKAFNIEHNQALIACVLNEPGSKANGKQYEVLLAELKNERREKNRLLRELKECHSLIAAYKQHTIFHEKFYDMMMKSPLNSGNVNSGNGDKSRRNFMKRGLSSRQAKAMLHAKGSGKISNREYCDINFVTRSTAMRDLAELVKKGLLKNAGKGAGCCYEYLG